MNKFYKIHPKKLTGFTLIELLVVIAIIGIITTISTMSFVTIRSKERDSRRLVDIKKISFALEKYYSIHGSYPNCANGCSNSTDSSWFTCYGEALEPFIGVIPSDPDPGRFAYCLTTAYRSSGDQLSLYYSLENDNPNNSNIGDSNWLNSYYGARVYILIIREYGAYFQQN